jgi:hypothetical protein
MHTNLMTDVWSLAEQKAAIAAQLAEIDRMHRQAVVLADTYGIKQTVLAKLSDVSPGRISQIVQSTDRPDGSPDEFHRGVYEALEWSGDQLRRIQENRTEEQRLAWAEKFELVHGKPPTRPASIP